MRLHNTSAFPDSLVREVYQFVKPAGILPRDVVVRNGTFGSSGHSSQGSRIVATISTGVKAWHFKERLLLKRQGLKASPRPDSGGYLDFVRLSDEERLVDILAHEARHQWQGIGVRSKTGRGIQFEFVKGTRIVYDRPGETVKTAHGIHYNARRVEIEKARIRPRRMVWGARGRYSERDADAYALRMVRAWRRAHRSESVGFQPFETPFERYRKMRVETFGSKGPQPVYFIEDRLTLRIIGTEKSEAAADTKIREVA